MNRTVAIVGKPNTGKSTLFNKLVGKRQAIVKDEIGVTRDRNYAEVEWCGNTFTMIDTGGITIDTPDDDVKFKNVDGGVEFERSIRRHIKHQAKLAINTADVVLFVVDALEGITSEDRLVADILRKTKKPVFVVANKLDNPERFDKAWELYELGFSEVFPFSATHGINSGDLLDRIIEELGPNKVGVAPESDPNTESPLRIAIVGKPNSGKSTLTNQLLKEERMIVSSISGTTRDSVDVEVEVGGKKYILTDTAGMRKKGQIEYQSTERFSVERSLESIKNSDVVVLLVDIEEGLTEQDINILTFINEEGKPSVIAVNKIDMHEGKKGGVSREFIYKTENEFKAKIPFMSYAVFTFLSALKGRQCEEVVKVANKVYNNASQRISTGTLNQILQDAFRLVQPPSDKGKRLKLLYATQTKTNPPTFKLFVNSRELAQDSYVKYIENFIRKAKDFMGTPIRIELTNRNEENVYE